MKADGRFISETIPNESRNLNSQNSDRIILSATNFQENKKLCKIEL